MPSGFSMKLRKHIRTKRLEDVRQVGMDRVVDFKFGSGESANHVILELYAQGTYQLLWMPREGKAGGGRGQSLRCRFCTCRASRHHGMGVAFYPDRVLCSIS